MFAASIARKKLSAEIILDFLTAHTWLGQEICRALPGPALKEFRWVDLVAPAVEQCINHVSAFLNGASKADQCILALDSLILKLEGMIRDLCESHGITTWAMRRRKDEDIIFEKDLSTLLYDPATERLFQKDDLLFLKFLLVERGGYNLRNRIAHALFMGVEDYKIEYCVWGLLALLRLSKYSLGDYISLDA